MRVGARSLAMGVLSSHGGSTGRPVRLPVSVPAPGSDTRHDASERPGVGKECGSLLPIWRDAVHFLSVDAAAHEPVRGALSVNATVCESMELVAASGLALVRKCGGAFAYLVSAVGSSFCTPKIDVARVRHCFDEIKGFSDISRLLQGLSRSTPVGVAPGGDFQAGITYAAITLSPSHTRAIRAKDFQDVVNGGALAFKHLSVSYIFSLHVSPLGAVEGRKLRIIHDLTIAGDGYRSNVNDDTDFSAAPPCELGYVFGDVCKQIMYLRQ